MRLIKQKKDFKALVEQGAKNYGKLDALLSDHISLFVRRVNVVRINAGMSEEEFKTIFNLDLYDPCSVNNLTVRHLLIICQYLKTHPSYLLGFTG